MTQQDSPHFYSIAEFARLSGDSESTIRRAIKSGDLPFVQRRPRKKIKIPLKALEMRSEPLVQDSRAENAQPTPVVDPTEKFSGPEPDWLD